MAKLTEPITEIETLPVRGYGVLKIPENIKGLVIKSTESINDLKDRTDIIFVDKEEWTRMEKLWQQKMENLITI